jgi:S-DNA-T family DNA segregation ATPase FtsK/SpoIIIE
VTVTVVEDVATVWPGDTPKVQAHVVLARLQEVFGGRYDGLDEGALTRALKAHGVPVMQVFRDGSNRNGYALADLSKARRAIEAD